MLGVSPLAAMNIMPSGGVAPENAVAWLDAGAIVVGMGSNLAGSDINYAFGASVITPATTRARVCVCVRACGRWTLVAEFLLQGYA